MKKKSFIKLLKQSITNHCYSAVDLYFKWQSLTPVIVFVGLWEKRKSTTEVTKFQGNNLQGLPSRIVRFHFITSWTFSVTIKLTYQYIKSNLSWILYSY